MDLREDILRFIRSNIAKFKAISPDSIDFDARIIEDIKLIGDDFSEIDYLLRKRYGVKTVDADYCRGMSIRDWADMIFNKCEDLKS